MSDRLLVHVASSAALLGAFFAVLAFGQTTTHIMIAFVAGVAVGSVTESAVEIVLRQNRARRRFVLDALAVRGWMHGLDLVEASSGLLRRGTVYVLLDRLEDAGLVVSWVDSAGEMSGQRVYAITSAGRTALWSDGETL